MSGYQPIESYGVIGDLNTVALVCLNGSIDFLCLPRFDSPSVFARILDKNKGGHFCIESRIEEVKYKQLYIPETNVLLTRFLSDEGIGELSDFMPVRNINENNLLIRRLTGIKGTTKYKMSCSPSFNYGFSEHRMELQNKKELLFISSGDDKTVLRLVSSMELKTEKGEAYSEFTLNPGESADFIIEFVHKTDGLPENISEFVTDSLFKTIKYWKNWSAESNYKGRWREVVNRSSLILKLMTSGRYGSIVAAPTFGLPEYIGGKRNWDYRYTWIRDASFTIYTLINLGYKKEATAFMKWVEKECEDIGSAGNLNLMYTVDGENVMNERILEGLEGYKKSYPVRIGNDAKNQIQLDIYGELMDSVYLYNKYVDSISFSFWEALSRQIDWLSQNWRIPDEGIWEVRGGKREFLYSRIMCWVAIDRALKLGSMRPFPLNPNWTSERDNIFRSIYSDFW
ncbi:MAG TPA: glycoside hydrolase family 15 protein, partial [Ignavibacteriaceae bacterium]|nr:glycoside hydrolase family 15 protein [Ignavibacteriaceae bacterium]